MSCQHDNLPEVYAMCWVAAHCTGAGFDTLQACTL
jgi:hypothetical protein